MPMDWEPLVKRHPTERRTKGVRKRFDWISEPRPPSLTPFQQFLIDIDWANSPLGPMRDWPAQLRHMVLLIVADPTPAIIYWGEEPTVIYNEAYIGIIQDKHPALQGQNPRTQFPEIWGHFDNLLENQWETGKTVVEEDVMLMLQRREGILEETYFSWKFVPVIGDEGHVVASHATVVEMTREIIAERRLETIRRLSQEVSEAKTVKDIWHFMMRGLEHAEKDVPAALLYSIMDYQHSKPVSRCVLEQSIRVPHGHYFAPANINLSRDEHWLAPLFEEAQKTVKPFFAPIPAELQGGFQWLELSGHHMPVSSVVICPVWLAKASRTLAFLVIALSPVQPYNEDYQRFIRLLIEQVTTPHVAAVLLEQEVERRVYEAEQEASDRARLSRELSDIESKFMKFSARAPIGLAILTETGIALSANDLWQYLTMLPVDSGVTQWREVLIDGEFDHVMKVWSQMMTTRESTTYQTATRQPWKCPELDAHGKVQWTDSHLLVAMFPDFDDSGNIKSVMSCITDISELKWTEAQLRNRMNDAIKMHKQQEKFIDMTSHEMRNPLSALIGCADEIITCLTDYRSLMAKEGWFSVDGSKKLADKDHLTMAPRLVDDAIEAADTIIYCAMHQKRIIDDILTFSRLDSDLLEICPEASQPINLIKSALKMYVPKSKANKDQTSSADWGDGQVLYLIITVQDSGRGLSPQERENLFQLFQQASPKTHVQYGGSGLGLFISRQLTEMQGGQIGVASEAGKGSIFEFYIKTRRTAPLVDRSLQTDDVQLLVREDAIREACGVEFTTIQSGIKRKFSGSTLPGLTKILKDAVKVVTKQLRNAGNTVIVANHGEEALDLRKSEYWSGNSNGEKLSVVLMDLEMPVMDGIACVKKIRQLQISGEIIDHVPIIAVTANARKDQILAALSAGMDDVTTKPYRIQDMLKQIEALVVKHK